MIEAESVGGGSGPNRRDFLRVGGLGAIGLAQNPHGIVEQVREGFHRFVEGIEAVRTFGRKRAAPEQPEEERAAAVSVGAANGAV